jgi:hypothetical protein
MPGNPRIHYVHNHASEIAEQIAFMRETVRRAVEMLRLPIPDTFLGRKTHDPFPAEDPIERADIQNLIHSELHPPRT